MKIKLSFKYHASNHWPSFRVWFNELCLVDLEDTSCAPVDFMFDVMPKYPMEHNELVIEQFDLLGGRDNGIHSFHIPRRLILPT